MSVDTQHCCYLESACKWQRVRDALAGLDAMRAGEYIPRLHEQDDTAYEAYRDRACYFPAPARVLAAVTGVITRKPAIVEGLSEDIIANVDLRGTSIPTLVREIVMEVASIGRVGSLIDWHEADKRPYVVTYKAEQIINWRIEVEQGKPRLTLLVLHSNETQPTEDDPYCDCCQSVWRSYRLVNGVVQYARYVKNESEKEATLVEESMLTRRGVALAEIPWVWHSATTCEFGECAHPPLLDLCDIAISHYRNSADLENGRHICGVPTPYAIGFGSQKFYLGSAYAWATDNQHARAGFLEFTGQGLGALTEALAEKERQMAALGSRLLEHRSSSAEAAETILLRNESETSALTTIAMRVSASLSRMAQWLAWWQSTSTEMPDASIVISNDFASYQVSPEMLSSLTTAYLSQAISFQTFFFQLQRAGTYPEDMTAEDELAAITDNPPPGMALQAEVVEEEDAEEEEVVGDATADNE